MSEKDLAVAQILLAEYGHLKNEQNSRVGFRDNLLYATLVSMAAVVAAVLGANGNATLLLLLPPVSVVLGWTYLANDQKISAIGRYIRLKLGPDLASLVDTSAPVFQWETEHRSDSRRRTRKILQLLVDQSVFCLSPLAALIIYATDGEHRIPLVAVAVVEAVAVGVLSVQIIRYMDLRREEPSTS